MLDNPLLHLLDQTRRERLPGVPSPERSPPIAVEAARIIIDGDLLAPGLTDFTPLEDFRLTE